MKKLAIIGTGMAGMSAAHFLQNSFDLQVFDNAHYIGGHTNTIDIKTSESARFDTGFMVFNHQTYPLMTQLFKKIGVPTMKTDMSFSVQNTEKNLEYCGTSINHLFCQRKNLLNPSFYHFLWQINRFNRDAIHIIENKETVADQTIGEFCEEKKYGQSFLHDYLVPMSSAVWSTPPDKMLDFPIATLVRFFYNHGFLGLDTQHQWYTVTGGSREYRDRLIAPFKEKININTKIKYVKQNSENAELYFEQRDSEFFDMVIFACHADTALGLIENPSEKQKEVLSPFKYQKNIATIHSDDQVMPKTKRAWSSWNYRYDRIDDQLKNCTIYYMNKLQSLKTQKNYYVSINDPGIVDRDKIHRVIDYTHPLFDQKAVRSQSQIDVINESSSLKFTGSYYRYGFHEDALHSSHELCKRILDREKLV